MAVRRQFPSKKSVALTRSRARRQIRLTTIASNPRGEKFAILIHNLSQTGVLVEASASLAKGDVIEIELPEGGARAATVVWSGGRFFGCEFGHDLSSAVISGAVLRAQPSLPSVTAQGAASSSAKASEKENLLSPRTRLSVIALLSIVSWGLVLAAVIWALE